MIVSTAHNESDQLLATELIESDRRYFEMAAETKRLSIGDLTWMPGLTELAASCVAHRVDPARLLEGFDEWVDELESELTDRAVSISRIYLDSCSEALDAHFTRRGYQRRDEIGFLAPVQRPTPPSNVRLCEVRTADDWRLKQCIHEEAADGPDGYKNQADLWVDMERRKCETGQMRSYLVRRDDEIVATVGAIVRNGLLRLKNIVVAPQHRRRGLAIATVHLLWEMAETKYGCRLGVFGVVGGPGSGLYRRAGLYEATCQQEWSRLTSR